MAKKEIPCVDAMRWLKERGWDLGPLTGQDWPALTAVAHCWRLWGRSDEDGRRAAIAAIGALVGGMQPVCWPMARELASQALDWSHRARLWPEVCAASRFASARDGRDMDALLYCYLGNSLVRQPDQYP